MRKLWLITTAVVLSVVWTTCTSHWLMARWAWELDKVAPVPMWISQALAVPLMASLIVLAFKAVTSGKRVPVVYACYAAWFLLLYLGYAPGCLTEDSYYAFHMVKNGWWDGWYSPLHPALLTAFVQILPWEFNAPGIFLALLWAAVYTAAHGTLSAMNAGRLPHCLLALLLLLPAQVASSIIIIRDGYFTALYLLFVIAIFRTVRGGQALAAMQMVGLAVLGATLMIYRTDAIPGVLIGLGLAFVLQVRRQRSSRLVNGMLLVVPVMAASAFSDTVPRLLERDNWERGNTWGIRSEAEYKLTLIESPLGYIASRSDGAVSNLDRRAIEGVFTFADLKSYHCPENLCVFYGGHWNRKASHKDREAAFKAALNVFADNPRLFIESRIATMDTVGDRNSQTICSRSLMAQRGYAHLDVIKPVGEFGLAMVKWMQRTETSKGLLGGRSVWWNVYIGMLLCVAIIVSFRWTPASSIAATLLLVRTLVVIAAAPAGFTVYYLTLFVGGAVLAVLWMCEFRAQRRWPRMSLRRAREDQALVHGASP